MSSKTKPTYKHRIPTISPDRLDKSVPAGGGLGDTKKDQELKAFLKDRDLMHKTTVRMPLSKFEYIKWVAVVKKVGLNQLIMEAIDTFLDSDAQRQLISRAKRAKQVLEE